MLFSVQVQSLPTMPNVPIEQLSDHPAKNIQTNLRFLFTLYSTELTLTRLVGFSPLAAIYVEPIVLILITS